MGPLSLEQASPSPGYSSDRGKARPPCGGENTLCLQTTQPGACSHPHHPPESEPAKGGGCVGLTERLAICSCSRKPFEKPNILPAQPQTRGAAPSLQHPRMTSDPAPHTGNLVSPAPRTFRGNEKDHLFPGRRRCGDETHRAAPAPSPGPGRRRHVHRSSATRAPCPWVWKFSEQSLISKPIPAADLLCNSGQVNVLL